MECPKCLECIFKNNWFQEKAMEVARKNRPSYPQESEASINREGKRNHTFRDK